MPMLSFKRMILYSHTRHSNFISTIIQRRKKEATPGEGFTLHNSAASRSLTSAKPSRIENMAAILGFWLEKHLQIEVRNQDGRPIKMPQEVRRPYAWPIQNRYVWEIKSHSSRCLSGVNKRVR